MTNSNDAKTCVILLAMGGPDSIDGIKRFLINIFSDREIIQLPGGALLQKPFARLICKIRLKEVQHNYSRIGGFSPLLKWTEAQKEHIEFAIAPVAPGFEGYIGMRYFDPYTEDTIHKAVAAGHKKLIFLPMYPQYCRATTGSSFNEVKRVLKKYPDVEAVYINDFHDNPAYIKLMKQYIDDNIQDDEVLLYSAHSIPQKFVDEGDPYVDQVKKTAQLTAGDRDYILSFQSRTGPVKWVGPDTIDETKRLTDEGKKLFIVPISFVCDHIETLFEIDLDLKEIVGEEKAHLIRRMPMFNDDRNFGALLADLILEKMK